MNGFAVDLFEGRLVVVTGAGRGIGRVTALAFAEHGAALVLVDRNANDLEATAREVLAAGAPSCRTEICDLGVEQQRNNLIRSLEQETRIQIENSPISPRTLFFFTHPVLISSICETTQKKRCCAFHHSSLMM